MFIEYILLSFLYMDYSRIFYQYIIFFRIFMTFFNCTVKWTWILPKEIYLINHKYYERNLQVKAHFNTVESNIPENSNCMYMYIDVSQLQEKTFDIGNNHSYIFSLIQETNLKDLLVHTLFFYMCWSEFQDGHQQRTYLKRDHNDMVPKSLSETSVIIELTLYLLAATARFELMQISS